MLQDVQYIDRATISIESREVLRLQGRGQGQVNREIRSLLDSQIALGHKLIKPRVVFIILPCYLAANGGVRVEGGREFSVGSAKGWTGLKYMALGICTIGEDLEGRIPRLFASGKYAAAAILDSVGSVAVESLADHVNSLICQQATEERLELTSRISPGYGLWPLEEQRAIFELLPSGRIGVDLNEGCMMRPRKSISFGIGIGPGAASGQAPRCRNCSMPDCAYRRE